jgi:hypothetical protein
MDGEEKTDRDDNDVTTSLIKSEFDDGDEDEVDDVEAGLEQLQEEDDGQDGIKEEEAYSDNVKAHF